MRRGTPTTSPARWGGRVTLLHVLEQDTAPGRASARRHLESLAAEARRPPAQVVLAVGDHDVRGAVVTFVVRHGVDLIVLAVGGEGGLADEALGRLAVDLARRCALPIHLTGGRRRPCEIVPPRWQRVVDGPPARAEG